MSNVPGRGVPIAEPSIGRKGWCGCSSVQATDTLSLGIKTPLSGRLLMLKEDAL